MTTCSIESTGKSGPIVKQLRGNRKLPYVEFTKEAALQATALQNARIATGSLHACLNMVVYIYTCKWLFLVVSMYVQVRA